MKHAKTILTALLLSVQYTYGQVSKTLEAFEENVLPRYKIYFSSAEPAENNKLSLTASGLYTALPADAKKEIMVKLTTAWRDSLVLVQYGSKRELWGWNREIKSVQLLDAWDLNAPRPVIKPLAEKPASHPWFLYIGTQLAGDNQGNMNFALNTRFGFFLLANRWDFATTLSTGSKENTKVDNSAASWTNFGLMSRLHFPMKRAHISPNIGGSVTFEDGDATPSLVVGLSWYVGMGSIDIGINIGNTVTGMGGYTLVPNMKRR